LNAIAERFVQTAKTECLDHFVVFGDEHVRHLVFSFQAYCNECRPHQARDNLPLYCTAPPPTAAFVAEDIVCDGRLGGLAEAHHQTGSLVAFVVRA
jgi:putative transposase